MLSFYIIIQCISRKNLTLHEQNPRNLRTNFASIADTTVKNEMQMSIDLLSSTDPQLLATNKLLFLNSLPEERDMAIPSQ